MVQSIVQRFLNTILHPWATMGQIAGEGEGGSIKSSIIFVVGMGLVSGIITSIVGMFLPLPPGAGSRAIVWLSVVLVPLLSVIGSFIGAAIVWVLVDGLLKSTSSQYKASYRIVAALAAFSPISAIVSGIPGSLGGGFTVGQILALGINVWATIVLIGGIIIVRQTSKVRTIVTCAIIFLIAITLGVMARIATEQQLNAGAGNFPDFGAEGGLDEDLQRQLDELANQAKTEQPKR